MSQQEKHGMAHRQDFTEVHPSLLLLVMSKCLLWQVPAFKLLMSKGRCLVHSVDCSLSFLIQDIPFNTWFLPLLSPFCNQFSCLFHWLSGNLKQHCGFLITPQMWLLKNRRWTSETFPVDVGTRTQSWLDHRTTRMWRNQVLWSQSVTLSYDIEFSQKFPCQY